MRPSVRMRPAVGLMIPAISLRSVVLPDPLRPMRPTASPRSTSRRDVTQRPDVGRVGLPALDEEILERAGVTCMHAEAARDALDRDLADLHAT